MTAQKREFNIWFVQRARRQFTRTGKGDLPRAVGVSAPVMPGDRATPPVVRGKTRGSPESRPNLNPWARLVHGERDEEAGPRVDPGVLIFFPLISTGLFSTDWDIVLRSTAIWTPL